MGLNRTPTPILEARGSFISHKNRKEARAGEPVVTSKLGGRPKTFTDEQKKLWLEFAKVVQKVSQRMRAAGPWKFVGGLKFRLLQKTILVTDSRGIVI
jgi:hypothetical protein